MERLSNSYLGEKEEKGGIRRNCMALRTPSKGYSPIEGFWGDQEHLSLFHPRPTSPRHNGAQIGYLQRCLRAELS